MRQPDVVATKPRLADGTPFPTFYYLTCPRAASEIGTLEASGLMKEMTARIAEDPELAAAYEPPMTPTWPIAASTATYPRSTASPPVGCPIGSSACTSWSRMHWPPGAGVNPLGDEALDLLPQWWAAGPCVERDAPATGGDAMTRVAALDCGTNSLRLLITDLDRETSSSA